MRLKHGLIWCLLLSAAASAQLSLPAGLVATVESGQTVLRWQGGGALTRLRFLQGEQEVALVVSGRELRLSPELVYDRTRDVFASDYARFLGFQSGAPVDIVLEGATSLLGRFQEGDRLHTLALTHVVAVFDPGQLALDAFPDQQEAGQTFLLSGRALAPLAADAYVTRPSGLVEVRRLEGPVVDEALAAGARFRLAYPLPQTGVYLIEINNPQGQAALNRPLYVGPGLPLVPTPGDSRHLVPAVPAVTAPLSELREQWLARLNSDRAQFGLRPLLLDPWLSDLGQRHVVDMLERDFFAHRNPDGAGLAERARALGLPASRQVAENLVRDASIEAMQVSLLLSGSHRRAVLDPFWTRVGLGVAPSMDGSLVGAQEFSFFPGDAPLPPTVFTQGSLDGELPSRFMTGHPLVISGQAAPEVEQVAVVFERAGRQLVFVRPVYQLRFAIPVQLPQDAVGEQNFVIFARVNGRFLDAPGYPVEVVRGAQEPPVNVPLPPNAYSGLLLDQPLDTVLPAGMALALIGEVTEPTTGVGLFLTAPDGEVRSVERPVYQGVFALPLELPPGTGGRFNLALGVLREEQYQLGESYELYTTPSELALHVDVPYPPNAFSNVLLDEWLPSRFQSGEGLLLRGSVSQPAREVVLFFDRLGQQYSYRAPVQDGRFQLEAELEAPPGQYQLGLSLDRRESILYPVVVE